MNQAGGDKNMAKSQHAVREEAILKFWKDNNIFAKSLSKKSPKGEFVFYEGPPTANGKPGIHHVEARSFKDVIPRYKTMRGFYVPRKAGWDTHGLPVELQVEKTLGFKSKKDIEEYGIAPFNKKCKESVFEYIDLWKSFTERIGYWSDMESAYFTFRNSYIETLWGVVGKISKQGLLYSDYRIAPWCARCGTGLSSHELAQGYQDVSDISLYVKFKVIGQENTYILAWTTTPWTLPGNVALAVGENIQYVKTKKENEIYIVAKERVEILGEGFEVIENLKGLDIVGLSYEPLYPYLKDNLPESEKNKLSNAFKVYAGDFVTTTDGTGVVHIAPMYGQDDFELATKNNLPKFHIVGEDGLYKNFCGNLSGRFVKEKDEAGKPTLDVDIIKYLQENNFYFNKENYKHSYPHCWRCKTPLIYYARDSWYIRMSALRDKLISENQKINWEPEYIKEGRFGEWLREIKDWAISRERYWGTPLPVWMTEDKSETLVIDSVGALKKYTKKSGNNYRLMRHGKTDKNNLGVWDFDIKANSGLNEDGKREVRNEIKKLKKEGYKPDIVYVSPFLRTEETMQIVCEELGIGKENIKEDARLIEWNAGKDWNGKSIEEFFEALYQKVGKEFHYYSWEGGESYADVIKRAGEFIYEIDSKHKDKEILIVSHASVLKGLFAMDNLLDMSGVALFHNEFKKYKNAEVRKFDFTPLPHNENYEIDFHKPFIDEVVIISPNGKEMKRVKEVMDVWFDSGAMPFAQSREMRRKGLSVGQAGADGIEKESFDDYLSKVSYPADFISEAIDQTRGWFYTLHAIGVLMNKGNAYKNVICLGYLLDKNGKKMSKSLGNVVDPMEEINKYGIDAIRLWMYSVNQPGESKNYDEKTVDEINKKIFNLISNTLTFYELYRDRTIETSRSPSKNILDRWILAKMDNLTTSVTKNMDQYRLLEPVRDIKDFVSDLSTWYLQLSRDRFRDGDSGAKETLYFVLKNLSKILAPFAPFFAEDLYQKLKNENDKESVHLEEWPEEVKSLFAKIFSKNESNIVENMEIVRKIVSLGLDARMKANIKVRQPLQKLKVKIQKSKVGEEYLNLIKDRVNVKEVEFVDNLPLDVELDIKITEELREEGVVREIIRFVQDMRKKKGLMPKDEISLSIQVAENGQKILENKNWQEIIRHTVGAKIINMGNTDGEKLVIDDLEFVIAIQ